MQDDYSTTSEIKQAFEILWPLYLECKKNNWDGYAACRIEHKTLIRGIQFLAQTEKFITHVDICGDPNGDICFEWIFKNGVVIHITLSGDGYFYYGRLLGSSTKINIIPYNDKIPEIIVKMFTEELHRL